MSWPADTLTGVYLFLFAFGLIFSVASLLLSTLGGHFHLPGATHAGHAGHLGPHDHTGHAHIGDLLHGNGTAGAAPSGPLGLPTAPGPFNLSTIMIFLTWFGATGYLLRSYDTLALTSAIVATVVGLLGAALAWAFLAKVLWRGQTQLDPFNYRIEGIVAQVSSPIQAGGTGEIIYELDGKRRVDGARATVQELIPAGTDVAILRFEQGLAYVTPLLASDEDEFLGLKPETAMPDAKGRVVAREQAHELAE
jgi:membrane protein implicated in regulation of membrane protease activity